MSVKSLPINERHFSIDETGDVTGKPYTGDFVAVCVPTLKQRSTQGLQEARMNAGLQVAEDLAVIHHIYSQVRVRLIKAPDWFVECDYGLNLLDVNILLAVWKRCQDAELEYRKELRPELYKDEPEVK